MVLDHFTGFYHTNTVLVLFFGSRHSSLISFVYAIHKFVLWTLWFLPLCSSGSAGHHLLYRFATSSPIFFGTFFLWFIHASPHWFLLPYQPFLPSQFHHFFCRTFLCAHSAAGTFWTCTFLSGLSLFFPFFSVTGLPNRFFLLCFAPFSLLVGWTFSFHVTFSSLMIFVCCSHLVLFCVFL